MKLPEPTGGGGEFERVPPGTHLAVCYRFIDLGTQEVTWQGETKHQHKVMISWELPNELMSEGDYAGKPFTFHQRYTWSMSDKANLRHTLEAWRGKKFTDADFGPDGFDIRNVLGKGCLLNLVEQAKGDKVYTNLSSVGAVMKGMEVPAPVNPLVYIALQKGEFDQEAFDGLSDRLKATIMASPEYQRLVAGVGGSRPQQAGRAADSGYTSQRIPDEAYADLNDEIPF